MSLRPSPTAFPADVSALLLSAMHPLFGTHVRRAFLSVQAGVTSTPSTDLAAEAPPCAQVRAADHCVRLHPSRFVPDSLHQHTVLVTADDIESLVRAYQAATLTVRILIRKWSAFASPIRIACPNSDARPPLSAAGALDRLTPHVEALLALPLATRIPVARTLFTVLTQPGRQSDLAHILHVSRSTLRNHLDAVADHLPSGLLPQSNPAVADVLPLLLKLWAAELEASRPARPPGRAAATPPVPRPRAASGHRLSRA